MRAQVSDSICHLFGDVVQNHGRQMAKAEWASAAGNLFKVVVLSRGRTMAPAERGLNAYIPLTELTRPGSSASGTVSAA